MQVLLAQPRGFCAGVSRAVEIVERALEAYGGPVYVFHEIVHNGHVVESLARRGAVFVEDIAAIPRGAVAVFSAHGVSNAVVQAARARELRIIDATCPLVTKVHLQAQRYARQGHAIVLVGHAGHEEVEGTRGSVDAPVHIVGSVAEVARLPIPPEATVAYVTQTTLSIDDTREIIAALKARFPRLIGPELKDICYATLNRQNAVRALAASVDLVLVVGARNSSNSNRLREVAAQCGVPAHLIDDARGIDPAWLAGVTRVGVTAGASAPEVLVVEVCARLRQLGAAVAEEMAGPRETVMFRLPSLPAAPLPPATPTRAPVAAVAARVEAP
ncbi:MAG: 4-hydroxy-3-methylbut-2-enyl diphosphate reductase [Proteobacteria bacterium]|nr:4-hydroxy-3-methylbut-2-enyl diphosphate reductase [Pseudomonadota bacterium]